MPDLALYPLDQELMSLLDSVETCPEELRGELQERIQQYVIAEISKIDAIGRVLSQFDSVQEHAKAEIERLRARQQSAENNARRLEAYVLHVLAQRGGKPLKGQYFTLHAGHSQALIVDDAELVPAQWKRTTVVVDVPKEPIKRALKAGEEIPGVHLETREYLVRR